MSQDHVNGAQPEAEALSAADIQRGAAKAEALIDAQIRQIVGTMIRGILVSAPGVPPHVVLNSIARQTGALCAGAVEGPLEVMSGLRMGFRDAFADGVKQVPIIKPPAR